MGDQMFPPLVTKNAMVVGGGGSVSNSSAAMFLQPELLEFAPELPDVFDVMNIGVSRLDIADMICRTSLDDVERLPAIHPSVMSSRGEQVTRYISFVSSPPIETRAPRDRPRYEKRKNVLGPEDCFRCQLKTDHSACERHKFLRVGGGFRHSYSYIKQILDVIEDKSRQQAAETARRLAKVREEQEHKAFLRATQQKRKVKTYIRTKSGKLIKQYVYITEKEYKEMKEDDVAARRILGLGDDEILEDFTSSRKKYVVNEDGEYVEVHKIRDDSAYQESLESVRRAQEAGKGGRRRTHRRRGKGGDYSDDSDESGVGGSAEGGSRRRRHRRRRRRGRSSSSASEESYVSAGGTKHARKPRRRRHRSRDDDGQRRRRRRRSYSSSYDSGSDDVDGDGKSRRRRHGKHGRRRRRSYSSDDSGDEGGDKRRQRRRRRRSYSESSGSDESRRGHRRRRGRRRRSRSQGSVTGSDGSGGSRRRRRRRHRRRHSDDSDTYSDDSRSSYDSTTGSRRRRRHRKHRGDGNDQDLNDSYSSGSQDGDEHGERRKHRRHRERRDGSHSSDYSRSSSEDNFNDIDGEKKNIRRRRRKKNSDDGSEVSVSYSSGEEVDGKVKKKKRHRRRRGSNKNSEEYSSNTESENSVDSNGEPKKRRKKKGRRKGKRVDGSSDESDNSDSSTISHGKDGQRRRHKKRHRRRNQDGDSNSSLSSDSLSKPNSRLPNSKLLHSDSSKMLRPRSYGSGGYDSDSYDSSSDGSTTYKTSSSSAVSSASSVSSVDSSDISSIEGDYTKEELKRLKQAKKERKKKEKQQAKQEQKEEMRKKIREEKRETKRTEREEKVKEKKKRREEKKKQRRKNKGKMSPVSSVSDVSSVNSDEISDVDSNLNEEQKRILIEEKKLKKKEAKKAKKFEEKYEKKKEEWKAKKKEKEKRRRVIELQKELERMSSASSIESVNSDEISSIDSDLSEGEKQRVKEKKKKKLKAERQLTKNILKAKERLKEKRKKEGRLSESEEDMDIDQMGDEEIKKAIKKLKRGKKKRGKEGIDSESDESHDNYAYGSKDKTSKKKNKKTNEKIPKNDTIELRAPDGTRIRVNIPKSMRTAGKFVGKIRLKMDGTVAADDDEDAESVIIDEDGNLVSQPTLLINPKTIILENESWEGFQPTPPPPKTPTDGGRVKFTGIKKVLHAFRKNGEVLQKHLDDVLTTAEELNDYKQRGDKRAIFIDERDSSIDYISHYRLVEKRKLDPYGKAFVVEDDDFNCVINLNELKEAIEGIPTLQTLKPKQLEYALKVLNIDEHSLITFKMFAVMAALGERVCSMDPVSQHLIDMSDLMDIERKMELYKAMFYCNVNSERSDNHITAESLHIELRAGGLNRAQEQYVMKLMKPDEYSDISFIDYMAYIPLFLSMHENIIDNPLDMNEKYNQKSEDTNQRDMNPLGLPLRRDFIEASEKKGNPKSIRTFIEKGDLVRKESSLSPSTLPRIASSKKGSSKLSQR